jgi:hypothetical protein
MNKLLIASVLVGVGCGGGTEGEVAKYRDKMCACDNKDCADKVLEDYNAWAKGAREEAKKMSKEDRDKIMAIDKELKDCRRKLRDADKGKASPDGSGSAAAPTGSATAP